MSNINYILSKYEQGKQGKKQQGNGGKGKKEAGQLSIVNCQLSIEKGRGIGFGGGIFYEGGESQA